MKSDARSRELPIDLIPLVLVTTDLESGQESNRIPEFISVTSVDRQAADWVLRIADPECSREQLNALDNWLGCSVEHEQVFTRLNMLWCQTERLCERSSDVNDRRSALERALSLRPRVLQHFLLLFGNRADAERLALETYRRLLLIDRPYLVEIRSMAPFLLLISTQVAQDHMRKSGELADEAWAINVLERLPKLERESLLSLGLYGYTAGETARKLGVTVAAVRRHAAAAIRRLQTALFSMSRV